MPQVQVRKQLFASGNGSGVYINADQPGSHTSLEELIEHEAFGTTDVQDSLASGPFDKLAYLIQKHSKQIAVQTILVLIFLKVTIHLCAFSLGMRNSNDPANPSSQERTKNRR